MLGVRTIKNSFQEALSQWFQARSLKSSELQPCMNHKAYLHARRWMLP